MCNSHSFPLRRIKPFLKAGGDPNASLWWVSHSLGKMLCSPQGFEAISRQCKGHQWQDCPSVGKPHGGNQKLLKQQRARPQLSPRPRQSPRHSAAIKGRTVTAWKLRNNPAPWQTCMAQVHGTARTKSTVIISLTRRNPALSRVPAYITVNYTDMAIK